jgi:hypothetical protein
MTRATPHEQVSAVVPDMPTDGVFDRCRGSVASRQSRPAMSVFRRSSGDGAVRLLLLAWIALACLSGWCTIACFAAGFMRAGVVALLICIGAVCLADMTPNPRKEWQEAERILWEADR